MSNATSTPNHDTLRYSPCLRALDGRVLAAPADRWFAPVTPAEDRVLERVDGPVLDVGCGPARHALKLAEAGIVTLGIDISLPALTVARRRGAPVLHRSIFERVPGQGRWGTALLLDGNIGIGGVPDALLRRVATLLRVNGRVLVEGYRCTTIDEDSLWAQAQEMGESITARSGLPDKAKWPVL